MNDMAIVQTVRVDIHMAGDFALAKQVCRQYCYGVGLCVHIYPADYIYTGGEEAGFVVGLINYPKFVLSADAISVHARALAGILLKELCQHSYTIVGDQRTEWHSRRRNAAND